ncbi:restriction endonuclease subunit S [Bernardetia sp. ABR2-2B]|uniref:restriction endonuclease subunit S n=1 Tax=Bernardetia sp. ABR2-2B TaxID=3127472 RepID=UPI0030CF67BF
MTENKYPIRRIKDVILNMKSGFGAGKQDQSQEEGGIIQIRPTNIGNEGNLKFKKNVYLPKEFVESKKDIFLEKGDVLFNNTNSQELVGKTSFFNENGSFMFSNHITRIRVDENKIVPYFLVLLFNSFHRRKIFYSICTNWNNQSGIGAELLRSLKIPIPPLEKQQEIVNLFQNAYQQKQQKEQEAKQLLDSIDDYLMEKLGIELSQSTQTKPFFYTRFSAVQGKRFDPKKYEPNGQKLINSLQSKKYSVIRMKDIITQSVAGDWGIDKDLEGFDKCLVIRATEFDNLYNLKLTNNRVKYRFISQVKLSKMDLQIDDLLIEKSGGSKDQPVGRIAIITEDIYKKHNLAYSNFIHKIRVDSSIINPSYLFVFLKTIHNIKITDLMQSQTNGIRNLIMQEYLSMSIPLPPMEVQNEIATHISSLRSRAKALEKEGKQLLKEAKQEVEKMILGE